MTTPTFSPGDRVRVSAPNWLSVARGFANAIGTVVTCPISQNCQSVSVTIDNRPAAVGVHFQPETLELLQ